MEDFWRKSASDLIDNIEINKRRLVTLFAMVAFLYWMGLYLYAPTLPLYAESKSSNLQFIGFALSMYGLGHVIVRLPVGILSGWLGRNKPLIIVGLFLVGLGALIMALAVDIREFAVGRAITGIAAGTWVPLILVFCGLFPQHEGIRATALLTFVGSVARLVASSITGILNEIGGYQLAFFLALCISILAMLMVFPIREIPFPSQKPSFKNIGQVVAQRDVLLPSLLGTLALHADWAVTFGFLPILAKQVGITNIGQSILLSTYFIAHVMGNLAAIVISNRVGIRISIYASFTLISTGILFVMLAHSLLVLLIIQACIGLAQGVCYPTLMGLSIKNVAISDRPTAMGLFQTLYAVGMFTGPWVSGLLATAIGIRPMFGVTALACITLSWFLGYQFSTLKGKTDKDLLERVI
jgi:MFS family permease